MKSTLLIFLAIVTLTGCSTVKSQFDGLELIWSYSTPIEQAETPKGFIVTPKEIKTAIPLTKYAWNIYADDTNYYLSPAIQTLTSKTGDNSHLAVQYGMKIEGKNRKTIEKIKDEIDSSGYKLIAIERLREITNN